MKSIKVHLAAMVLGVILVAGNLPLEAHAVNLSPNAGGTVIADTDVPLAGDIELEDEDAAADTTGTSDVTSIEDENVPLSNMIMGNGCSFPFHLLLLLIGTVVGVAGTKVVEAFGGKKEEKADGK